MIFWKYIKGLAQGGTIHETGTSTNTERYTYIEFQPENNVSGTFTNSPWIYFNNGAGTQNTPLGHIITQSATGQHIDTAFSFYNTLNATDAVDFDSTLNTDGAVTFNSTLTVAGLTTCNGHIQLPEQGYIYFHGGTSGFLGTSSHNNLVLHSTGTLYLDSNTTDKSVVIRRDTTQIAEFNSSGLSVSNRCQATYFNATSDKRAKTNLKPLSINVLDLIKRVQLYSFKYKDSDLPSIGILAQDVQDVNIEGFDLVDNKEASGVDMDYMSIHESKLTYILWKAIQEQQKEIEELKIQIKNLTK